MTSIISPFRRLLADRRGATAVTVGLFMTLLIGMSGFVIDIGHVMYVKRELQASADAAALAGARELNCCTTSIAASTATAYSAAWTSSTTKGSNKNIDNNLYVQMASGYPKLKCFTSTGISCTGPDNANGVVIQQTATVPMWFASIFGISSIPVTATATAGGTGGGAGNYDIDIILDTTASMGNNDATCGMTRIKCALSGLQLILNKLSPNADYIGVMAFPPLSASSQQSKDDTCPSGTPTTTAYKNVVTGGQPTYQIVPLSHDYQTSTQGTLNTSSKLVVAAGGSTCAGIAAPGGYGTFYADAITAAQTDLTTNGRAGVSKAIIILSDGDANATSTNMKSTEKNDQCTEAVTAANAATTAGTSVFTIAYGSATSGSCSTDTGADATSACATMQNMASKPEMFYSDDANGCVSPKQTLTGLIQIFGGLTSFFTAPRLLPDTTT
jgi:Flp pilus assembly protein TadG